MAQLPRGIMAFESGRQSVANEDARNWQNFGQALDLSGKMMQVQDLARARNEDEQMKQLFRDSGGDLKTMRDKAYQSGFYKQGLQFDKQLREQAEADLKRTELLGKIDEQTRKSLAAKNDMLGGAYEHAFTVYKTLQRGRVPEEMARAEAQKAWMAARNWLAQDPMMQGVELPEQFDPDRAIMTLNQTKRMKEILGRFMEEDKFSETRRANQAREQAKAVDQVIARGNLAVSQANLGVSQQRLGLERERFAKENDPAFLSSREAAKTAGRTLGEAQAQAQVNLPQATATAERSIKLIDDLLKHPGFKTTVGATLVPGARFVPGTDAADFQARFNELQGGAFLQAFETLKGGGQITEVEGRKATEAITRMSLSQSEKEFRTAAQEFQDIARKALARAKSKAGQPQTTGTTGDFGTGGASPPARSGGIKFMGFE